MSDVAMMRHLLRYPPHVLTETQITTGDRYMYHISPAHGITEFVPRTVQRAMPNEDHLVPRVCTAPTLMDCIRGYAVTVRDSLMKKATNAGNDAWEGGYYIYRIPCDVAVKPTTALCPMAEWCDERWLLPYERDDQPYPTEIVGRMFYNKLGVFREINERCYANVEIMIEIYPSVAEDGDDMIPLDKRISLGAGCHAVNAPGLDSYYEGIYDEGSIRHRTVTRGDFLNRKSVKADLLSYKPLAISDW